MVLDSVLDFAKRLSTEALGEGAIAVDATIGNGHDTLFLARTVGATGHVYGFDVQVPAIERTRQRLEAAGVEVEPLVGPVVRTAPEVARAVCESVDPGHHSPPGPTGPSKSPVATR